MRQKTLNQADFRNCIEDIITTGLLKVGPTYPLHITLLSRSIIFHIDTATATIKMYILIYINGKSTNYERSAYVLF